MPEHNLDFLLKYEYFNRVKAILSKVNRSGCGIGIDDTDGVSENSG